MHQIVVAPCEIALRPLDLDNACPGIGEPQVHIGAATACSRETTRRPERGRGMGDTLGGGFYIGGARSTTGIAQAQACCWVSSCSMVQIWCPPAMFRSPDSDPRNADTVFWSLADS